MDSAKTVLLLEDELPSRIVLREALAEAGFRVLEADGIAVAAQLFRSQRPDLAILDLGLPDGSGLELCRSIRAHPELGKTPVIILTAQAELKKKGQGFEAGADHYLVKPVAPDELLMWVRALLRRLTLDRDEGPELKAGDCLIELQAHIVRYKGEPVPELTKKEFELLCFLVSKRPKALSRKLILSRLWHTVAVDQVVDNHIGNLRRKLPRELADRIQTVPGKGFRFLG